MKHTIILLYTTLHIQYTRYLFILLGFYLSDYTIYLFEDFILLWFPNNLIIF